MSFYPSFEPMFEHSRYLAWLNVYGNVEESLATLRGIVARRPIQEIEALFADGNWRTHLVGAVALLLMSPVPPSLIQALWTAFDRPSWVTPQLAVVASRVDPQFRARAEARIEKAAPKGRAALLALLERPAAVDEVDHGDQIALKWRERTLSLGN